MGVWGNNLEPGRGFSGPGGFQIFPVRRWAAFTEGITTCAQQPPKNASPDQKSLSPGAALWVLPIARPTASALTVRPTHRRLA